MLAIEDGAKAIGELAKKFPLAQRIVASLLSEGMISRTQTQSGEDAVELTDRGRDFLERRALF